MNEELKSRALEVRKRLILYDENGDLGFGYSDSAEIIQELLQALEAQEIATGVAVQARREAVDALRRQSHRTSGWC